MVYMLKDIDLILIDLREIFGRAIHLSELDAAKVRMPDHPDRTLTLSPDEKPVFLDYVDKVVIDFKPRLIARLAGPGIKRFTPTDLMNTMWDDFREELDDKDFLESEDIDKDEDVLLVAVIGQKALSKEGLEMVNYAMEKALVEGVLYQWQEGVPQYADLYRIHERNYENTLKLLSSAASYRTTFDQRIRIPQRF